MNASENIIQDSYKSIPRPAEGLFKDNGSRFISFAYPVETEEEVKDIVSDLKRNTTMPVTIVMPTVWATSGTASGPMMTGSHLPLPEGQSSAR